MAKRKSADAKYIVAVVKNKQGEITDVKLQGSGVLYPVEKIIQWIQDCGMEFYTKSPKKTTARVEVMLHPANSKPYIQTVKDSKGTDNLKSLPVADI